MKTDLNPAPDGYPIKIVRDGTPRVINSTGKPGELFYAAISQNLDRVEWLCRKLGEEVVEYLIGRTTGELCDVLAVIEALLIAHGETLDSALESLRTHPRGGFSHAVMMYGRHPEFDVANNEKSK